MRSGLCLAVIGSLALATVVPAADDPDKQVLKSAKVASDGPALLDYLRQQIAIAANPSKIADLVRKLGDDDFGVREQATTELMALGRAALPQLKKAGKDEDPEIARRAEMCQRYIEQGSIAGVPAAAVRIIGQEKPSGAAEVLLAYLPVIEQDPVADDVRTTLALVAVRDGQIDPMLKAALQDKLAVRRGAAAEAICRSAYADARSMVMPLLKDPEPTVRLRAGLALARRKEKDAVPVLIDLLALLPADQIWSIDDLLLQLAGTNGPTESLGADAAGRKKYRDAWAKWWSENSSKTDLAKLSEKPEQLGFTLVVLLDRGEVMELDRDNKARWKITGVQFPLDVQMLAGERVLLAEQQGDRVTERDRAGAVVWQYRIDGPLMAQRLPNGNTFIANRNRLVEVGRDGKEVASHSLPGGTFVMRAFKLPNGDIACITMANRFLRMDANGKTLRTFPLSVRTSGGRIDVLRNGHVVIPLMDENKVVEYDDEGRIVWQAKVSQPIAAVRLPNGNTIVTSMDENRAVEIDRAGKEVWTFRSDSRVTRAFRR